MPCNARVLRFQPISSLSFSPLRRPRSLYTRTPLAGLGVFPSLMETDCEGTLISSMSFWLKYRYSTFKLTQAMPGGEKMVAFTRILHRTQEDILVNEVRWPWAAI
jgi:hypothetical protein